MTRRRRESGKHVTAWVKESTFKILEEMCDEKDVSLSSLIREMVLNCLDDEEKQKK